MHYILLIAESLFLYKITYILITIIFNDKRYFKKILLNKLCIPLIWAHNCTTGIEEDFSDMVFQASQRCNTNST